MYPILHDTQNGKFLAQDCFVDFPAVNQLDREHLSCGNALSQLNHPVTALPQRVQQPNGVVDRLCSLRLGAVDPTVQSDHQRDEADPLVLR